MRRSLQKLAPGLLLLSIAASAVVVAAADAKDPHIAAVLRFREAQDRADVETQRALLSADSRIWYEKKEGVGEKREPDAGGGSWSDWDRFFRSESTVEETVADGGAVRVTVREINDWYRLVDRAPSRYYMTYYFDGGGRIEGTLVHQIPGAPKTHDRLDEFKTWARREKPGLVEKLMPESKIDPSLDRAKLWKESLLTWRRAAGLQNPLEKPAK